MLYAASVRTIFLSVSLSRLSSYFLRGEQEEFHRFDQQEDFDQLPGQKGGGEQQQHDESS